MYIFVSALNCTNTIIRISTWEFSIGKRNILKYFRDSRASVLVNSNNRRSVVWVETVKTADFVVRLVLFQGFISFWHYYGAISVKLAPRRRVIVPPTARCYTTLRWLSSSLWFSLFWPFPCRFTTRGHARPHLAWPRLAWHGIVYRTEPNSWKGSTRRLTYLASNAAGTRLLRECAYISTPNDRRCACTRVSLTVYEFMLDFVRRIDKGRARRLRTNRNARRKQCSLHNVYRLLKMFNIELIFQCPSIILVG